MITINELQLFFGSRPIFNRINATLLPRDCIGLVGSNGAGKTTLLKTLVGIQELDGGNILKGKAIEVGYLPQDGLIAHGKTLFHEVEQAAINILNLKEEQKHLEERLQHLDPSHKEEEKNLILSISELDERLLLLDASTLPARIESILLGLGFKMEDMQRQTSEFSGGWQMRIALAKLLLAKPDLLLLDEPTNHLDLPSQRWLERFLKNYPGAIMMVSHDQAFLDGLCNRIFELSRGHLSIYTGNYSSFEEQKMERALILQANYQSQEKKIEKTQVFINRFRAKASKAGQVQSRIKALEKIERIEIQEEESRISFKFPPSRPTGQQVLKLEQIHYGYQAIQLFEDLSISLEKGEKIGIVGPNGAGKSTLLKLLAGILTPKKGIRSLGHQVDLAYFAQHQADELDPSKNVLDTVTDVLRGEDKTRPRSILGSLLFTADDVFKPVKVLSGGEKNRLALAKILLKGANCLLLDEPTNHLDIYSKRVLQEAIKDFEGTLVIVSHDRAFLDPIVTRVWELKDKQLKVFYGNISAYVDWVESLPSPTSSQETSRELELKERPKQAFRVQSKAQRKAQQASSKRLQQLEEAIKTLEAQKDALEIELTHPQIFKEDPQKAHQLTNLHAELLEELNGRWEAWAEAQEAHSELFGPNE